MLENYDSTRWKEELDLALAFDPENVGARGLSLIGRLPAFVRPALIHLLPVQEGSHGRCAFAWRPCQS